ncbi:MAG TPA: hypothetical protein VH856_07330 [Steroidobacteraceae bacterium]|jgi:hypothetical protein
MSALHRSLILALASAAPLAAATADGDGFTDQFPIAACDFQSQGRNAFFKLVPGRQLYLSNVRCLQAGECDELEELWITVLDRTRDIRFHHDGKRVSVRTRVVEEYETADGEVEEISRNYFASCAPMNDVYYFGEDVFDGDGNKLPDAWLAGRSGARPGIIMPDRAFLLGARYYQEIAPNAQDRAEHTSMGFEVEVPAGVFRNCVEITETSPLEPGHESLKTYCPHVGLVRDGDLELIAVYSDAESPSEEDD